MIAKPCSSKYLKLFGLMAALTLSAAGGCGGEQQGDLIETVRGAATVTPAFVRGNAAVPQTPQTSVPVAFPAAQGAGNLNVVIVGWGDAVAHTIAISDSRGNSYQLASLSFTQAVPEPASAALLLAGALVVWLRSGRRAERGAP